MVHVASYQAMQDLGEKIGKLLRGGEVIELIGDVGAGKTTFVRGLAKGLGVTEQVQSPSFTINRVYDADNNKRLIHYDFYRLSDPGIMADELAESLADQGVVTVIEWADTVTDILPIDRITLSIVTNDETSRDITITSAGKVSDNIKGASHDSIT